VKWTVLCKKALGDYFIPPAIFRVVNWRKLF